MSASGPPGGDCGSCADERATGAAFCEVCGRALSTAPAGAAAATPAGTATAATTTAGTTAGSAGTAGTAGTATGSGPAGSDAPAARCPACATLGAVGADGYCTHCGILAVRPRDHVETALEGVGAVTDRGRRHHRNEDAVWLSGRGADVDIVVCDGVSSSFDPDVASAEAARTAGGSLVSGTGSAAEIEAAIVAAGAGVAALAADGDPRRATSNPACTIVVACVRGAGIGYGWVGDSRAYWVPAAGAAVQLTEDDSWASQAIRAGMAPAEAYRHRQAHAITAWLGADAGEVRPRTGRFVPTGAGHLLVCSDGLWNYLTDPAVLADTVREHLRAAGDDPHPLLAAARSLTAFANTAGGSDNITVALTAVAP